MPIAGPSSNEQGSRRDHDSHDKRGQAGKQQKVLQDSGHAARNPATMKASDGARRIGGILVNAVESFFAWLFGGRLKRGVFRSVVDLQAAINRFLAETNSIQSQTPTKSSPHRRGTQC